MELNLHIYRSKICASFTRVVTIVKYKKQKALFFLRLTQPFIFFLYANIATCFGL